jgi:hypothetical protein
LQEKRDSRLRNSSIENKLMPGLAGPAGSNSGVVLAGWVCDAQVIVSRRSSDNLPILPPIVPALEGLGE